MRSNYSSLRDERSLEHALSLDIHTTDTAFAKWLDRMTELNLRDLEELFEQQMEFFAEGSTHSHRQSRGRARENLSIGQLIERTRDLQLEMCDLALLTNRLNAHITEHGLQSAARTLRRR